MGNDKIVREFFKTLRDDIISVQDKLDVTDKKYHENSLLLKDLNNSVNRLEKISKDTRNELEKHLLNEVDFHKSTAKYWKIIITALLAVGFIAIDSLYPELKLFEKTVSILQFFGF